jgi:hypothetical protein
LTLVLASCGGGKPQLQTPTDGQVFPIGQGGNGFGGIIQATLADNSYDGVTIRLKGDLPPGLQQACTGGDGTPLTCYTNQIRNTTQQAYTVIVEAVKGDQSDYRFIKLSTTGK